MFSLTKASDLWCDCCLAFIIVGSEFKSMKTAEWAAPKIMNSLDLTNSGEGNKFPKGPENNNLIVYFSLKSYVYSFSMT